MPRGEATDVLLTGLPRSGTTLSCELLNRVPDTIALDEPMFGDQMGPGLSDNVARFLETTRVRIREQGLAPSRHVQGRVDGSKVSEPDATAGRRRLAKRGDVDVGRRSGTFTLVVKHNAAFTGALPDLCARFRVCAVVRHPLLVLGSWQTVPMNVRDGRVPAGERHDPELAGALAGLDDVLPRQLHLLRWFFGRFLEHLPRESIVRYEDIVASGGRALAAVVPDAACLDEPLSTRNTPGRYGEGTARALSEHLRDPAEPWWRLYERESYDALVEAAD